MVKKVMVFGTFDTLHPGHLNLFEQAKALGDYLIVVVARDASVEQIKGRKPVNLEAARLAAVRAVALVDEAVLGQADDKHAVIVEHRPDTIALGYDQHSFEEGLEETLQKHGLSNTKIVRLKAFKPEKYKSSLMQMRNVKEIEKL